MCNNAMKYNKPGTVYHKAAKRLLHAGLKQLTPQKLRPLGDILTYMYEIPIRELGFDIGKMDVVSTTSPDAVVPGRPRVVSRRWFLVREVTAVKSGMLANDRKAGSS